MNTQHAEKSKRTIASVTKDQVNKDKGEVNPVNFTTYFFLFVL